MLILIESRSMLSVYWLGERKLNNAYLTEKSTQNSYLQKDFFENSKWYIIKYTSRCYNFLFKNKQISKHICKLGNALNWFFLWMLMRKFFLAMLMLAILMLILMLLNLNTDYADTYTDADLCIRIFFLCCNVFPYYNIDMSVEFEASIHIILFSFANISKSVVLKHLGNVWSQIKHRHGRSLGEWWMLKCCLVLCVCINTCVWQFGHLREGKKNEKIYWIIQFNTLHVNNVWIEGKM